MKTIQSARTLPVLIAALLSACGDSSTQETSIIEGQSTITTTLVRDPLSRACIPIGADGNQALASSALGLNVDTTMLDLDGSGPMPPISIRNYINQNEPELGGRGAQASRTAGSGYFRAATAYSLYLCDTMAGMNHVLLQDLDNLAMSIYGAALFVSELIELDQLKQAIAQLGGSPRQQAVSQCAALLSSTETQCVQ